MTTEPELVLLDEATAGMSRDETPTAVELTRRLTQGRTVVIIEHDMDVVCSVSDRITVLHRGEILATGSTGEIRPNQAVKDAYLGEIEAEGMLLEVAGLNTCYADSHALRDFSLTIDEGEIVAFLGRNGMGKSTVLRRASWAWSNRGRAASSTGAGIWPDLHRTRWRGPGSGTCRRSDGSSPTSRCSTTSRWALRAPRWRRPPAARANQTSAGA